MAEPIRLEMLGDQETKAGNYFVSNYPPYSFWKQEAVPEVLDVISRKPAPGTPLGIYTHIPFCRKRCHFCYFRVYTDKNAAEIQRYVDAVIDPADTRSEICAALHMLRDKRERLGSRKHDNTPL